MKPLASKRAEQYADKRHRALERIQLGKKVKETLESAGWQEVVGPLIDKMIIDTIGGKIGDVWTSGVLAKCKKEETVAYYIGYKQYGVDLHNRLRAVLESAQRAEGELQQIDIEEKEDNPLTMEDYDAVL